MTDLQSGITANVDAEQRDEALQQMSEFGWTDIAMVVRVLRDRHEMRERRLAAAAILGGLRYRDTTATLIDAIAEGDRDLAWACSSSLNRIKSRKHGRKLIEVLRKTSSAYARQAAIYSIWMLNETRAEKTLIRIGEDLVREEEQTRSMAVEALGITAKRLATQLALERRLFDSSVGVCYSALCALCGLRTLPVFLRRALLAKLQDPARLDDDRIVAKLAGEILERAG